MAGYGGFKVKAPSVATEHADLDKPVVILDNGSGHMKAGLSDEQLPKSVFPAVVGRPKHAKVGGESDKECYLGESAMEKRGVFNISYPVEHGIVNDWGEMEAIWRHTFENTLRINPEEHAVIVTEAPFNPKKNRERMVEVLFEKFSIPACYIVIQAVMSLYSSGRTTGCIVDSGDGVTHVVPVYEGFSCSHAIQRLNLAGRDLTDYMCKELTGIGHHFTSSSEKDIVRDMKETQCYVCANWDDEEKKFKESPMDIEKVYLLPDGNEVHLGQARYKVPEVLFDPMKMGKEMLGIHEATAQCVQKCDIDLRRQLLSNIILSGGTTMFPGIAERLTAEIKALFPQKVDVKVIASPQRRYLVWMGAAIVANLSSFHQMLVWKSDYDEIGPSIVHTKCF